MFKNCNSLTWSVTRRNRKLVMLGNVHQITGSIGPCDNNDDRHVMINTVCLCQLTLWTVPASASNWLSLSWPGAIFFLWRNSASVVGSEDYLPTRTFELTHAHTGPPKKAGQSAFLPRFKWPNWWMCETKYFKQWVEGFLRTLMALSTKCVR